jgi:hypothetical protein
MPELNLIPGYKTSWIGNTFAGGPQWVQNFIDDMVVENRGNGWRCYTNSGWDEAHSERGEYWFDHDGWHMLPHKENEFPAVSSKAVAIGTKTIRINADGSTSIDGGAHITVQGATALGVYRPKNLLMVAAGDNTIKFFDVTTGSPVQVRSLGAPGGIMSGDPGKVTPTKFWGLTGCGSDAAGNLYISMSELGAIIRKFAVIDPQGLAWNETEVAEMVGLHFGDVCDFDPKSDGKIIFGKNECYELDYSQPVGKQWTLTHCTYNKAAAPNDPRTKDQNCVKIRYKDGFRRLFSYDQNDDCVNVYRFNGALSEWETSIPDVKTTYVDDNCDAWNLEDNGRKVMVTRCAGVVGGKLSYATKAEFCPTPAPFVSAQRLLYDSARDVMYIAGGTVQLKAWGYGHPGPVIAKFSSWTTTRHQEWAINIPYKHDEIQPALSRIVPEAWDFAGDRLYIAYLFYDVSPNYDPPYHDSPGPVQVYDTTNGKFLGSLIAGPEVFYHSGSVDLFNGISALQREDGTHAILVEEVWKNKNLLYLYKPEAPAPPPPASVRLTVKSGDGDGLYRPGTVVAVSADMPKHPRVFDRWIGDTQYVAEVTSPLTPVTIPNRDITIEATYIRFPGK